MAIVRIPVCLAWRCFFHDAIRIIILTIFLSLYFIYAVQCKRSGSVNLTEV